MLIFTIPLSKNIDYVLMIWLGEVPKYTSAFVVLTLMDSLIAALNNPLLYGVLAAGKIKVYEIVMSSMCMLTLVINYGMLSLGLTPVYVYIALLIFRIFVMFSLVWQSKIYGLKWRDFIKYVAVRVVITTTVCVFIAVIVDFSFISSDFLKFLMETGIIVLLNGCVIFMIGFSQVERKTILTVIKTKILPKINVKAREK